MNFLNNFILFQMKFLIFEIIEKKNLEVLLRLNKKYTIFVCKVWCKHNYKMENYKKIKFICPFSAP